jgi:hypothetical protein
MWTKGYPIKGKVLSFQKRRSLDIYKMPYTVFFKEYFSDLIINIIYVIIAPVFFLTIHISLSSSFSIPVPTLILSAPQGIQHFSPPSAPPDPSKNMFQKTCYFSVKKNV